MMIMEPKKVIVTILTDSKNAEEIKNKIDDCLRDFVLEDGIASLEGEIKIV